MKFRKLTKSIILFSFGALSVIGYYKITKFLEIDKCLDHGGKWSYSTNECHFINDKYILNHDVAYELKFTNNQILKFVTNYIEEVGDEINPTYVLAMNVEQLNGGKKYTLHIASHEIYANLGEYNYEDKLTKDLEPQILYVIVNNQIVLIKSGIEKLNTNLNRYEYLLELASNKIDPIFKTRTPHRDGFFEINAPPTQHYNYWVIYECDNNYETFKFNAWGEILNEKEIPEINYCNHIGAEENYLEPLESPNE